MIKGDIFLEKTIKFTVKNKLVIKLVLFIEYLVILLETINSVQRIKEPVDSTSTTNLLSKLDKINPYRYFINTVTCSAAGDGGMLQCTLPTPIIFFVCFGLYIGVYILYKLKYELSLQDVVKQQDGKNFDMDTYLKTSSTSEYLIINWFNLGIRLTSTVLYFIIINAIVSSIIGIANATGNAIDYPQLILGLVFVVFATLLNYHILNSSSLMFPYKELKGHFGGDLCKRYDLLLIPLKIIITLQNNLEMMKFNLKFTHTYLSFLIVLILLINVLLIVSDMTNGKIAYVVNMKLNSYRLFFLIFDSGAILYTLFFYESFDYLVLSIGSFIWVSILSLFITKGLIRINEKNILCDEKIVFLCIYLFRKMNKEVSNHKSIVYQFIMHHKSKCSYLAYHKMEKTAYPDSYKIRDNFNHHCHICSFEDPEGLSIETLLKQIKHNKQSGAIELTEHEYEFYKMIKLIMNNNDSDIIGLVYKVNKVLAISKGDFNSFVKLYYNLISMKPENQESIKRFTGINKALEVTKNNDDVIKSLNDVYDCVKSKDGDLLCLAERLSSRKKENIKNITYLNNKNSNIDNFTSVMLRFVYENLFNDDVSFKDEKTFYDYEDYISNYFSESKIIDIIYNHSQMNMKIMKCSHHFIDYQNRYFEDLFPLEIINEQKMHVMDLIKNAGSNEFEFDCLVNNLPDKEFVTKMKLSCNISYSLEVTDYFISGKYSLLDDDIILASEDRLGLYIISYSERLGSFLHLAGSTIKIFQMIGMKIRFNDIFSKKPNTKDGFVFNINRYLRYFESIVNEYEKQSHSDELLEVYQRLQKAINECEYRDLIFSIKQDVSFNNFFVFSVKQPEILVTKKKKAEKKGAGDDDTPSVVHMDSVTGSQSSAAGGSRGFSSGGSGAKGGNSLLSAQEEANNRRLVFYSRLLAVFSVLVIVYCFFLMYNGISDNMRINESFNIKNYYDKVERFYYHTIACLMNAVVVLDKNKANLVGMTPPKEEFVEKVSNFKDVSVHVQEFLMNSIQSKVEIFQTNVMDLQLYVSSSHYQEEVDGFFLEENITYSAMSIIGNEIRTVKTNYSFFEALKISMNNLRKITPENGRVAINIIDSNSKKQDYSNIPSVNIDSYQILTYEVMINYVAYLKHLVSARNKVLTFHDENLNHIFDKSFMLSYILMAIHLILIFISILLIGHLSKIMDFNSRSINNTITKEVNLKLMKRKLQTLSQLNKYYSENPSILSKKLGSVRNDLGKSRRLEEAEKKQNSSNSDYLMQNKNLMDDSTQVFSVDKEKHLNPLSKLIFIMLTLYYVYSVFFIVILKNSTNNIHLATAFFEASSRRFKQLTNSVNLMRIQVFTNNTDYELYRDIKDSDKDNEGYISYLHTNILKDIRTTYDLMKKYPLFSSAVEFYETNLNCNYIYYGMGDATLMAVKQVYEQHYPGSDVLKSLKSICTELKLLNIHDRSLLDERIIYDNYKQLFTYNQILGNYDKMKELSLGEAFQEILINFELVFRPYITYFNNKILNNVEQGTFDNFLMMSIIYLALNIFVDFVILFTFQLRIIKRIRYINDDLNMLFDILRIY